MLNIKITLKDIDKPRTAADVDKLVRADVLDPLTQIRLNEVVTKSMLHRKCGVSFPNAPCMRYVI